MELQASRAAARTDADGNLVLLADQDRSRWDRARIARGLAYLDRARAIERAGAYQLQAAIAACHARAASWEATDWRVIVAHYRALARVAPSPVVELNRAVAIGLADGPEAGLSALDQLDASALRDYHLLPAARADFLRRLGRWAEAAGEYRRALDLADNARERAFLAARLAACEARAGCRALEDGDVWPRIALRRVPRVSRRVATMYAGSGQDSPASAALTSTTSSITDRPGKDRAMSHYHDSDDLKVLAEFKKLAPAEFKGFVELDSIVGRDDGKIPRKYRELIAIAVACTTQCPYCLDVHTKNAKAAGATREEVTEVRAAVGGAPGRGGHHARRARPQAVRPRIDLAATHNAGDPSLRGVPVMAARAGRALHGADGEPHVVDLGRVWIRD